MQEHAGRSPVVVPSAEAAAPAAAGKQPRVPTQPVPRSAAGGDDAAVHAAAERGAATPASRLPFLEAIQRSFGRHDVSGVQAHRGGEAEAAAGAMGADAYATRDHVVLGRGSDLHTVAHEAAHVVQQRGGVQLKGGVGAAGDPYERHADAVADRVVAGESAEHLLDAAPGGGSGGPAVQRQGGGGGGGQDTESLQNQANLKGPSVEIPALEGALLATRRKAVQLGLISQAAFDAGLALSQAMTKLQPAVAAGGAVDPTTQEAGAVAAQQLFAALQGATANEFTAGPGGGGSVGMTASTTLVNPYTEESKVLTIAGAFDGGSYLARLPELIRGASWPEAYAAYRRLSDGFDRWITAQLRASGPENAALGNAHEHYAQLRTGLEQIAGKQASRLPAVFHPDPATIESERAAGRTPAESIPMNVYFWKDEAGKTHLYDLTAPSAPKEEPIDGEPTAAAMATFFEEVARYPAGSVHYTLPAGDAHVAPTTGKIKWYEWLGLIGLGVAAVGLAFATAGASVPATVCFAAGAVAGGVSAAGHLVDSTHLGTATTASIVLDAAQIVASFASFGALTITIRAGSAAAALATSRYFVPLLRVGAAADAVQLVALSDLTVNELQKVMAGAGTPEDKQRAAAVLISQLIVMGGLTALSVKGARDAAALSGKPLELVEQEGVTVLRVVGDKTALTSADGDAVASDIRWQIDKKNADLARRGEPPRFTDVEVSVRQGMTDLAAAEQRGFPYGFESLERYQEFGSQLRTGISSKPLPENGIAIPLDRVMMHGSSTWRPAAGDFDVAVMVDAETFQKLLEQSFPNQIAKVRAAGQDPFSITVALAEQNKWGDSVETFAYAVENGVLKRNVVRPRLSDVKDALADAFGKKVDLSIVKDGGNFDRGPYMAIP
jgi:hypothetical protein